MSLEALLNEEDVLEQIYIPKTAKELDDNLNNVSGLKYLVGPAHAGGLIVPKVENDIRFIKARND